MTKEDSIRCKYCMNYEADGNWCHRGSGDYDKHFASHGEKCNRSYTCHTSENGRCSWFALDALESMARALTGDDNHGQPHQRSDGSYVLSLDDVPYLKKQLENKERPHASTPGCLAIIGISVATALVFAFLLL